MSWSASGSPVRVMVAGWALFVVGALAVVLLPVVGVVGGHVGRALAQLPLVLTYFLVGALAFLQRPGQRAAVRLLGASVAIVAPFTLGYAWSAFVGLAGVPAWSGVAAVVLAALGWVSGAGVLTLMAVFPDGRYLGRPSRALVVGSWLALPLLVGLWVSGSATLEVNTPYVWLSGDVAGSNVFANPTLSGVGVVAGAVLDAGTVLVGVGVVLLVVRYRASGSEVRRQIAWPLYGLGLTVFSLVVLGALGSWVNGLPMWVGYALFYPVLLFLPVGLLIGMVRYRLLDIDLVVRRSLVFAVLWLLITVVYVAVAAAFGVLVARRVPIEVAVLLTIVATVVGAPARRWLERLADRLVYGHRLGGYETLSELGARLESSLAPSDVADVLAGGIRDGLGARWVRVAAAGPGAAVMAVAGSPNGDGPALVVPLARGDEQVGTIECGPKVEGVYRSADGDLLRAVGRQATLAMYNARLAGELSDRLVELRASRERLVEAEESTRRRLERDLHDGVQQELVALLARLAMARNQLGRDPATAAETLGHVQADARRTLERLQEVARGIYPPVLTDRGLVEAVQERLTRLPLQARLRCSGIDRDTRLDRGLEAAAYFVVSEALVNVVKHARADTAWVRLGVEAGTLAVEVDDDGCGFDVGQVNQRGLRGLADRVEVLGGELAVDTHVGIGTRLRACFPVREGTYA